MTVEELLDQVLKCLPERQIIDIKGTWIVWTGGEPTLQLTEELVKEFKELGFRQAIETNGTNPVPEGIDYISCAPKLPYVTAELLGKNFPNGVDEFRFPCSSGEEPIPIKDLPIAKNYFVSPLFLGEVKKRFLLSSLNLKYCINWVKQNPGWRLSVQQHKLWDIR
jgi:organic radical activating enzyme